MNKNEILITITVTLLIAVFIGTAFGQQTTLVVNSESGEVYREGLALFKKGNYEQAAELFNTSYQNDRRNINALFAYGMSLNKLGKFTDAAQSFKQVIAKDNGHIKAHWLLPVALANAGKTDEAIAAYDAGISALPDNYNLIIGKATLLIKLGRHKDAIPVLNKAAELDTDKIDALEKLMFVYRELGDVNNAYSSAQKVLKKDDKHARAFLAVGDYHRSEERYEEAINAYNIAAKNIDTKAYAEHYIDVIKQTLDEIEIEKEYQARLKKEK